MDFKKAKDYSSYISKRGISSSFDDPWRLWRIGLLKADYVESDVKLRTAGLLQINGAASKPYYYADARKPRRRTKGWKNAFVKLDQPDPRIRPYFHPFRLYVSQNIERVVRISIHPMQVFHSADRYPKFLSTLLDNFNDWTSKPDFLHLIEKWNSIASLCVLAEPIAFEKIFGHLRSTAGVDFDEQRSRISLHQDFVKMTVTSIGLENIEKSREDLCLSSRMLEGNRDVKTILRLMSGKHREKLTGNLGASMIIQSMAETLRIVSEDAFGVELQEEDDVGYGPVAGSFKMDLYGSKRIIDGGRRVANEYLRDFGLDYGERIRWYLEGDTEYGAIDAVLGKYSAIELVNLKGDFIESKGKGVSFRGNLREDLKTGRYSCVCMDADNEDYVRALKKAASDDEICGLIWLAEPDFELHNFSVDELIDIIWNWSLDNSITPTNRGEFRKAIGNILSANDLWKTVHREFPELRYIGKGKEWGERLIAYANENPHLPVHDPKKPVLRPIIDAIGAVLRSVHSDYYFTRKEYRVDPVSLQLVKRSK